MFSRKMPVFYLLWALSGCGDDGSSDDGSSDGGPGSAGSGAVSGEPDAQGPPAEAASEELVLSSPVFENGGTMPSGHRCNAPSPVLQWSGGPSGTLSHAIVMRDLDYMNGFLHWIIYDIPASTTELPEGVPLGYEPAAPAGAKQATLAFAQGYFGPCSPTTVNTYQLTLHALDVATLSGLTEASTGDEIVTQIEAHSLAATTLEVESGP